jgi:hypothetical protein
MLDETPTPWFERKPPMWVRWVLSLGVAAILLVALILFVSNNNGNDLAHETPKQTARSNAEAIIVVRQDQAPHEVTLTGTTRPDVAHAIRRDMVKRVASGNAGSPLQHVRCTDGATRGTRAAYRCNAKAAGVTYPYEAVLDRTTRRLTFCKHDASPVPSMNIPVSPRCRL